MRGILFIILCKNKQKKKIKKWKKISINIIWTEKNSFGCENKAYGQSKNVDLFPHIFTVFIVAEFSFVFALSRLFINVRPR